jgi:alpha-ketoglutarate-dependent taurine dioxygenase/predicted 2-oxoglutarate/Fe(II)-dependent dioxygenase YbiX
MISINKNFLTPEEIKTILNYIEYMISEDWQTSESLFWNKRILDLNNINNPNPKDQLIKEMLVDIRQRIIENIKEVQGVAFPIYADTLQIVKWPKGYEQEPHADGEHIYPEDGEHPFPHRLYASVCYLNNDFDGGEIYFPQHDIELKPVPGTMVNFPGTREYLHGVRSVDNGIRYTIVSFYTKDISKADNLTNLPRKTKTTKTKTPKIVEWPGLEHIENNPELYLNMLLEEVVFVFRNANLSFEEQNKLHLIFGEIFNGFPNKTQGKNDYYTMTHKGFNKNANDDSCDDLRSWWHQEHVYHSNDIVYGNWNNTIMNTDKKNGRTYFYDMQKFYNTLPNETKEFLKKCTADVTGNDYDDYFDETIREFVPKNRVIEYSPIGYHWITNEPLLRVQFRDDNILNKYDGRPCTPMEQLKFDTIMTDIRNFVINDENNRIVHEWQKGDLVVSDLYKCAHAVTGGFNMKDREFIGMLGNRKPIPEEEQ